jgi:putative endonuclease
MKSNHRLRLGYRGEALAAIFLENVGYTILERNYRTPYGEIDLITMHGNTIAFIEVKTRANSSLGPPEISVTHRKAEHMRNAAEYYIQEHPDLRTEWRIDVISIQIQRNDSTPLIVHFENAIN